MKKKGTSKRFVTFSLVAALTLTSAMVPNDKADAASTKKVKSVSLTISKKKVTKKTYNLVKGKKATISVAVTPKKALKSIAFKTNKKKVATVTKKGVVTAKKAGTAKITVTVTGQSKKTTTTWVKIKVTAATAETNETQTSTTNPTVDPTPVNTPNYNNTPFNYSIDMNPIGTVDENGDPIYGGDPSILVDGDTVYLYVGHDVSKTEAYNIPEYCCFSTKDLRNWTYQGVVLNMEDVTWGTSDSAWAGQVMKYNNKYYMYYCSWDKTDSGKQSIGVAVADKPTGPFIDIGTPLVKGSVTTNETSAYNDIDPTAWIETDSSGVEHRYLSWGNGKVFVCELNEDMISVKDINGDGKITFGTQASGKTSKDVDIIEKDVSTLTFTEAPWIYRRQDENGKYYGNYYLFYAYGWREQMAYATTDDLMDGTLKFGSILMEPSVTSNTNHMAVFDFGGKTYFVYHNGSLPAGSGFRRTPCIAEVHFNEDGSIQPIPETASGIFGTASTLYTSNGDKIAHENFNNSSADSAYPYTNVAVGAITNDNEADSQWVMTKSYYSEKNDDYVSIQSENKPGLYLTVDNDTIVLAQNADLATLNETAKNQTFKKVSGLNDAAGVSFESVSKPGKYITSIGEELYLTDGSHKAASTFYIGTAPAEPKQDENYSSENSLKAITVNNGYQVTKTGNDYSVIVPSNEKTIDITFETTADDGYVMINKGLLKSGETRSFSTNEGTIELVVCAPDYSIKERCNLTIEKDYSEFKFGAAPIKTFNFEDTTDGAVAVTKGLFPALVENPTYTYVDGVNGGKALSLPGTYGMKLCETAELGNTYSIAFWMNPTIQGSTFDPLFAAGTFEPQYWINITADGFGIWSYDGGYVDIENQPTKKYETGKWQQVTVTVTSDGSKSTGKLYLNGELIASGSVADSVMTRENAAAYFGVNGWDSYFNGAIDEIMMFNRELSEDEVYAISKNVVTADSLNK